MIKTLFVTAALLAPGFAYAGNPSADLSVQVVPATTAGPCGTIIGQAGTDAAAAGFNTCALYNDFTTAIPNSVGTGLPAGWLNCNGNTADTGAVWNVNGPGWVPCPAAYQQVKDPVSGALVLDIDYKSAYENATGGGWPYNMAQLITVPAVNNATNSDPAHSFSNAYYEITYRLAPNPPGDFAGMMHSFWQFNCCNTGNSFVDNEIFEDWSYWGQGQDFGWNWWGPFQTGAFDRSIPNHDVTTYHTIGGLLTSDSTNFSHCMYFDGARIKCDTGAYQAGQSGAQRRSLIIWNGLACNWTPQDISCVGLFTEDHMYIKSVKVASCPAEPTGGSCIGTNFNGNFYTP
jgi:hypothetical protein